jgi:uncharacterized membrane protein
MGIDKTQAAMEILKYFYDNEKREIVKACGGMMDVGSMSTFIDSLSSTISSLSSSTSVGGGFSGGGGGGGGGGGSGAG